MDDTRPVYSQIQALGSRQALIIEGSEPLQYQSVQVLKTFLDFDDHPQPTVDISDRFSPVNIEGRRLQLNLKPGAAIENNAHYTVKFFGIRDLAGNLAAPADAEFTYLAEDLLAPASDLIVIRDKATGAVINAASNFRQGTEYELLINAEDNYTVRNKLKVSYRVSTNGGLSYDTAWKTAEYDSASNTNLLPLAVTDEFTALALRVRVSDERQFSEKEWVASVSGPSINLNAAKPMTITPEPVEELALSEFTFLLEGDLDLVRKAQVQLFDNGQWLDAEFDQASGQVNFSYRQPRLTDVGSDSELTVPARLRVSYGIPGKESHAVFTSLNYQLVPDATAPELTIVAPADGDLVPKGRTIDMILRSYDRYGVAKVEACVNSQASDIFSDQSNCQQLTDPSRLTIEVPADSDQPLVIQARATDLNGLQSSVQTATLVPYNAEAERPDLTIINPEEGGAFRAGERIPLCGIDGAVGNG